MAGVPISTFEQDPTKYYLSSEDYETAILDLGTQILTGGYDVDTVVGSARVHFI